MVVGLVHSGGNFPKENKPKSLIDSLVKNMNQNPDVVFYRLEQGLDYLNNYVTMAETQYGKRVKDFHFYAASKSGKYTVSELNDFMLSLIPENVKPVEGRKCDHIGSYLMYGNLYFKQKVGEVTETIELTDESILELPKEALKNSGFPDGTRVTKRDAFIGILLQVFPDEQLLRDYILNPMGPTHISDDELALHKKQMIRCLPK